MRTAIQWTVIFTLAPYATAQPAGVHAETRQTYNATAITSSGETYLAMRDVQVDFQFPMPKQGKGALFILFEPRTGLYERTLDFSLAEYPQIPPRNGLPAHMRVGVTAERMTVVAFTNPGVFMLESTERAASLDEAEVKSLRWAGDHLAEILELRMPKSLLGRMFDDLFPDDFFSKRAWAALGRFPLKLITLTPHDGRWDLVFESTENQKRIKVPINRFGSIVGYGIGQVQESAEK